MGIWLLLYFLASGVCVVLSVKANVSLTVFVHLVLRYTSAFLPKHLFIILWITGHKPNKNSESKTDWQTKQKDWTRFKMEDNPTFKPNKQEKSIAHKCSQCEGKTCFKMFYKRTEYISCMYIRK